MVTTTTDGACRPVAGVSAGGGAGLCPRMPRLDRMVNRSFRKVEKAADWLMGSAGPIFVGLAILLVSIGAWTFFLLFLPSAFPPHSRSFSLSFLPFPLALITCLGVIYTIAWFYASACRTPPGFVASFALESCRLATAQVGDDEEAAVKTIDARWNAFAREARQRSAWVDDGTIPPDRMAEMRRRSARSGGDVDEEDDDGNSDDHWPRVKMCFKCPKIPLWKALAYLPPELREVERKKRVRQGGGGDNEGGNSTQVLEHQQEGGPSLRSRGASPSHAEHHGRDEDEADEQEKLLPSSSPSSSPPANTRSPFLLLIPSEEDRLLAPLRQSILLWLPSHQAHTLVPPPKPERTHHCSVCRTCVIKYDHHCPWLNQCVGLYNERHFLLFLGSLVLGCAIVLACGAREFIAAAKLLNRYDAAPRLLVTGVPGVMVPRGFVLITYVLSLVMGFALAVMGGSHALMLARGETNVEASDRSSLYEALVKRRGGKFANVYDVGSRRDNLRNWLSVEMKGEETRRRPGATSRSRRGGLAAVASRPASRSRLSHTWLWISALLPVRRPTTWSDGWHWPKRKGLGGVHAGIVQEEELTDDEVDRDEEEEGEDEQETPAEGSQQPEMRGRAAAERR